MTTFAIVADATCDLGDHLRRSHDITLVPGHLRLPDGREVHSGPDWSLFSAEDFYKTLKKDPKAFSTSPANAAEFEAVFEAYAAKDIPVLAMSISSGISGAQNFMQMARKNVLTRHPSAKILCIDTLRYSVGFGLMVLYAAEMRASGKSIEETARFLEDNKACFRQAGWLDDLKFVASKGRINHAQAFFGTLAGIKPLGELDKNGLTTVLTKVKGAKAAYAALLAYMEATIREPKQQTVLIAQTDRYKQALEFKALIEERFSPREVLITDVYPLCGANIGPGLMAAYYFGAPISENLEAEKKLMAEITAK